MQMWAQKAGDDFGGEALLTLNVISQHLVPVPTSWKFHINALNMHNFNTKKRGHTCLPGDYVFKFPSCVW